MSGAAHKPKQDNHRLDPEKVETVGKLSLSNAGLRKKILAVGGIGLVSCVAIGAAAVMGEQ